MAFPANIKTNQGTGNKTGMPTLLLLWILTMMQEDSIIDKKVETYIVKNI